MNRSERGPSRPMNPARAGLALIGVAAAVFALASCGLTSPNMAASRQPVPAGPLGPVFPGAGGDPPIECRGLARERCAALGAIEDGTAGIRLEDIRRVIVSCEGAPCTANGGAFRIDVVLKSSEVREIGRGGYGEFEQP